MFNLAVRRERQRDTWWGVVKGEIVLSKALVQFSTIKVHLLITLSELQFLLL